MGGSRWVGKVSKAKKKKRNWVRGGEKIKFQNKKLIFVIRETKKTTKGAERE